MSSLLAIFFLIKKIGETHTKVQDKLLKFINKNIICPYCNQGLIKANDVKNFVIVYISIVDIFYNLSSLF